MFQVVTLNANGLRSAVSKGLLRWLARREPDVTCLQEVKAQQADLSERLLNPAGLHAHFHFAQARGYSGAALLSRRRPRKVQIGSTFRPGRARLSVSRPSSAFWTSSSRIWRSCMPADASTCYAAT
jgi:exonuclease III